MSEHALDAPSAAARRNQCPASTRREALFPEEQDSPEARQGTAAHWAAAEQLAGRLVDVGLIAPNGVVLDEEMVEGSDMMFDDVTNLLKPFGLKPSDGKIETRVVIRRPMHESFGTPDYHIVFAANGRHLIYLWDYKFGHRVVDVFENPQLIDYIIGIADFLPNGISDADVAVVATIVQPRSYTRDGPVRRWTTTLREMRALININQNSAGEALGENPRARVGPECRDCRARHACQELQRASLAEMDVAARSLPLQMPVDAMALELRMARRALALMSARADGLEQHLEGLLKSGKTVPGWALESNPGKLNWTRPAAEVIALGAAMGVQLAKPPAPITPTQARKAGLDDAVIAAMADREPGSAKLVQDDGSRARAVFGRQR